MKATDQLKAEHEGTGILLRGREDRPHEEWIRAPDEDLKAILGRPTTAKPRGGTRRVRVPSLGDNQSSKQFAPEGQFQDSIACIGNSLQS